MADDTDPATKDPADEFAEALARFDERLCRGDSSEEFEGNIDSTIESELVGAQACLRLLERAFPRAGQHPATEHLDRLGRFELIRIVGQGGFGIVYLARDPGLGRLIALKVPRLHTLGNAKLHERFLREARAAAALDHPNILPILETGEIGPVCYIASNYCDGADLAHWIKSNTPAPARLAARIVAVLADATDYSHTQGILHRDLKPSNVLLAARTTSAGMSDEDLPFILRLTDFGLAQLVEEGLGETGSTVLGTPLYMAPEQATANNNMVCPATDVYALGVILYELLTARPPFHGPGFVEVLDQIRSADPLPPSRLVPSVSQDLETICLKCLQKEISGRYASAGELRDDLQRFMRSEPVLAKPASIWDRSRKWAYRHPGFMSTFIVSFLSIAMLLGGLTAHLYQVKNHLRTTENLRIEGLARESKLRQQFYSSEIEAASNDLSGGAPELAQARLSRFIPVSADNTDLRGPEWHYLWRTSLPVSPTISLKSADKVISVATDSKSRFVVAGNSNGTVTVWDLESGRELKSFTAHEGEVRAMCFTPDGGCLVTAGCFRMVRAWSVRDWTMVREIPAHSGTVMTINFNSDGTCLLSGGRDGEVRCWDWINSQLRWGKKVGETLHGVRFAEKDKSVYCIHDKSRLTLMRSESSDIIYQGEVGSAVDKLLSMDLPADSRYLVAGGYPGEACCFDTRDRLQWALPLSSPICSVACSRDGAHAAFGTASGEIYLLQFPRDSTYRAKCWSWYGHVNHVRQLQFSMDGKNLLSGGDDAKVKLWALEKCGDEAFTFLAESRDKPAAHGHWTATDSNHFVTAANATRDGWVRIRDIRDFHEVAQLKIPNIPINGLAMDSQSGRLAALTYDEGFTVWDHPTKNSDSRMAPVRGIRACAFSPDGRVLAIGATAEKGQSCVVELYNPITGSRIQRLCALDGQLSGIEFNPQGNSIAVGFDSAPIQIVDIETGITKAIPGTANGAHQLSFNASGTLLAAGRWLNTDDSVSGRLSANRVYSIDMTTGNLRSTFRHGQTGWQTSSLAISPNGRLIAVCSSDGVSGNSELILWNVDTERKFVTLNKLTFIPVRVSFLPGGESLAVTVRQPNVASNDGIMIFSLGQRAKHQSDAGK